MKKLWNPIAHFDEKKLLMVGLATVVLTVASGYFFGLKMVSLLKYVDSRARPEILAFSALRAYGTAIVVLYFYGLLINRKTRLLDIINTVLISTLPAILAYPVQKIPFFEKALKGIMENPQSVLPSDIAVLLLLCLVMMPCVIYQFVILLNGFRTATNLKAWYHVALFFVILLIIASFTPYLFKL
ncbi:MAG: hypothetical protein LRY55_13730 [Leadbetterella sp.]|nr:hypothetical protein [Leadbetterella sp.]